ncbi:hypothetical protein B9Z19DRAFT_1134312 [Tuber borchii]|uniref:Uncharacterized protein n=1 Tax=Tuber borchii TaxID=42251 RepID=A0A2T6ZEE5_TUBBO|nr:hypothetical protein B9Z19DRAFT_1134312 [Tuber borchii]
MYRKSILLAANRPVKDQHPWLPLSENLEPSSTLLTDIAINYSQTVGTASTAGGGMLSPRGNRVLTYPALPAATYRLLRNSLGDSYRLVSTHHLLHLVLVVKFPAAYVRIDFVEDMLSLLVYVLELARMTTSLDYSYFLGINIWPSAATLLMGLCWGSLFENPIHCSQSCLLKPPPRQLLTFSQRILLPVARMYSYYAYPS